MNQIPVVKIRKQGLAENTYYSGNNVWVASNLVQWCKEKRYPIFNLPLAGIDLSYIPWSNLTSVKNIASHFKRVQSANLDYPVILDDHGYIADRGKWYAEIQCNKQKIRLGSYVDKNDAIKARLSAEYKYFGKYKSKILNNEIN